MATYAKKIEYINNVNGIDLESIDGFFTGRINPPSKEKQIKAIKDSDYKWIAIDRESNEIIGFITAISDGVLSSYIPILQVLPEYKWQGISSELVTRMLNTLKEEDMYTIDLVCDESLVDFFERFDMIKTCGMIVRKIES